MILGSAEMTGMFICCEQHGAFTFRCCLPYVALQERNHVIVCLLLGVAALGFPLYDLCDIPDGPFAEL